MKKLLTFFLVFLLGATVAAEEEISTTLELKHVSGKDVVSLLNTLMDDAVSIQPNQNELILDGVKSKVDVISEIIRKIDSPPVKLNIDFIASGRRLQLNTEKNSSTHTRRHYKSMQTMSVIERQWVKINTGLSVPLTQRIRNPDGTERQSFHFVRVKKSYLFRVHEFSGWSVVQVGVTRSKDIQQAIANTALDTTIIGKTGEWLEVPASSSVSKSRHETQYQTRRSTAAPIWLYLRVHKQPAQPPQQQDKTVVTP